MRAEPSESEPFIDHQTVSIYVSIYLFLGGWRTLAFDGEQGAVITIGANVQTACTLQC